MCMTCKPYRKLCDRNFGKQLNDTVFPVPHICLDKADSKAGQDHFPLNDTAVTTETERFPRYVDPSRSVSLQGIIQEVFAYEHVIDDVRDRSWCAIASNVISGSIHPDFDGPYLSRNELGL